MVNLSGIFIVLLFSQCIISLIDSFLSKARYQTANNQITRCLHSMSLTDESKSVESSLEILTLFNKNYLERMKIGRSQGKSPMRVELERAQVLKADGIKKEREELRAAVSNIRKHSIELSLGIMSESGKVAIETLKAWVNALDLSHGQLHGVDDTGNEISTDIFIDQPVYIKYNSSDADKAYIKKYKSDGFVGVIIQPVLIDRVFRQYGDLPLKLF